MTIQMIPLNKLIPSPANVRKTGALDGIDELACSIAAHGLLQNLQVRPGNGGKYEVVAGGRRLAALQRLAKAKTIAKSEDIPCHVLDSEDATEISLAENLIRMPMHPADQYEAFKALADQGKGPQEIAARFGCSPATVKQRLKLANVSPRLIEAYRADEIDLDQLMAFAVSDDHAAQEQVWASLPRWNHSPETIRSHLMTGHVDADDRRVRFVGIKAYKKAGGHIVRDLFQPEHGGYLSDVAILDRLVIEKLEAEAVAVGLDMTQWWQPTAESYLRQVPKAMILEAVREAVTPEAAENLAKLKKDALAAEAEQRLTGTGWLPAILRSPAPVSDAPPLQALAAE